MTEQERKKRKQEEDNRRRRESDDSGIDLVTTLISNTFDAGSYGSDTCSDAGGGCDGGGGCD